MFALLQAAQNTGIESIPAWGSLGVGGAVAALVFWFYRQDRKDSESRWEKHSTDLRAIIVANTEAMTALKTIIERSEDHR